MHYRGIGTRSEGRRTPNHLRSNSYRTCSELYFDNLYLRAACQPKTVAPSVALKSQITNCNNLDKTSGDYVQLKPKHEMKFNMKRQILLAITESYSSDTISVKEGDVVSLLAFRDKDNELVSNPWYFIRNQEGYEGYIPSSITNEFL